MLGNYGGLPLDRLHGMLRMFVVSPKYDKTHEQLQVGGRGCVALQVGHRCSHSMCPQKLHQVYLCMAAWDLGGACPPWQPSIRPCQGGLKRGPCPPPPSCALTSRRVQAFLALLASQGKVQLDNGVYRKKAPGSTAAPLQAAVR